MNVNPREESLEIFGKNFNADRNKVIQKQTEVARLCQNIIKNDENQEAYKRKLHPLLSDLSAIVEKFAGDIQHLKTFTKNDQLIVRVQKAVTQNKEIFQFLDDSRGILSNAKQQLEEAALFLPQQPKSAPSVQYEKKSTPTSQTKQTSQAFYERGQAATEQLISADHSLYDLDGVIQSLSLSNQKTPEQGVKVSGLDAGTVKRGVMTFRSRNMEGNQTVQSIFHVSQPAREKLTRNVEEIVNHLDEFNQSLPSFLKGKITVEKVPDGYSGKVDQLSYSRDLKKKGLSLGQAIEVRFAGIGSVRIGNDAAVDSLYRRITIEVAAGQEPGDAINQIQGMMTMLGLGPILSKEGPEEEERKKIALLFRSFYPREAYQLERTESFYEMSPDALKTMISKQVSEMNEIFLEYLSTDKMTKKEISAGHHVWCIPDLSQKMREAEAVGLMIGFNGLTSTLAKVINAGPLCSQERFELGLHDEGTSPVQDHLNGGAGSVFSRLLTKKMLQAKRTKIYEDMPPERKGLPPEMESACQVDLFPHAGRCQLLYNLDALNIGAYAYAHDRYGSKSPQHYGKRENMMDFSRKLEESNRDNEVMVPAIQPQYLEKILVRSEFSKQTLIEELKEENLVELIDGSYYIKGYRMKTLDKLIITGKVFAEEMWG